jgi:hypothetical protein
MIDLEDELRASLRAYGNLIDFKDGASAPVVPVVLSPTSRQYSRLLLVAAVVAVLFGSLVWITRARVDTPGVHDGVPPGRWTALDPMSLSPRKRPSVVWTGYEFLVWGGEVNNIGFANGAALDPVTNRWRPIAANSRVRAGGNAVWAGSRMVVLSGTGGQAYDPRTDSWAAMPELRGVDDAGGFTDAVYSGGQLYGVSVQPGPQGEASQYTLVSAWRLDAATQAWVKVVNAHRVTNVPLKSFVSVSDQFMTHSLVATDDGFAVWDGNLGGWMYSANGGWKALPKIVRGATDPLPTPLGLVWAAGRLTLVSGGQTPDHEDLRVTTLNNSRWSPWTVVGARSILGGFPVAAGNDVIVLGVEPSSQGPRRISLTSMTSGPTPGYPLQTVIDQGAAWSGTQMLVCGGQRPTTKPASTTADPGPVSNQCALWTP